MFGSRSSIVHSETIPLEVPPALARQFVMTPERILDYYPGPISGGVFDEGRSFYCHGKSGVSLLELIEAETDDRKIVLKVTTAMNLQPPFSVEKIKVEPFFTMVEDWEISPAEQGSLLVKTWRDVQQYKLRFLPLRFIVKRSAKKESVQLQQAWNRAALNR